MCARKPIVIAVVVALLVALASMFTVSVFLPWSHAVNVPNMTLEQWQALSEIQRNEFLHSHTLPLKGILSSRQYRRQKEHGKMNARDEAFAAAVRVAPQSCRAVSRPVAGGALRCPSV